MAVAFEIPGKTQIFFNGTLLGQTDADDVPEWEEIINERVINTNGSGPFLPAGVIGLGRFGLIRANLIQVDLVQLELMQRAQGASAVGQIGSLGVLKSFFTIDIRGIIVGSKKYAFPTVRLVESPRKSQIGNMEQKFGFVWQAIPDPAALQTATTPIYTPSLVV